MNDRPKSIPELRGHAPIPADRLAKYSAGSYSAMYGIPIGDAAAIIEACDTHQQVERMIIAEYINDADYRKAAVLGREINLLKERGVYEPKPGVGP